MSIAQGGYLQLLLYRHPSGARVKVEEAVERLKIAFPEVVFLPGDQLASRVAKLEKATADERARNPASPLHHILESERRQSQTFGPAYAFRIPEDAPRNLWGRVRRYEITFHYDTLPDEEMRSRIVAFLLTFGVGWIEEYRPEAEDTVLLYDLKGNIAEPVSPPTSLMDAPAQGTKTP